MTHDIVIPQVGEAASELQIVRWRKQVGEHITEGEILFELDIEKSVLEVESLYTGTVTEILAEQGSSVEPLQVVGRVTEG
jgi:2-oxoglutarate dehydrogenase E2 component (dihydrolipoamide succinyltransferase)